MEKIGYISQCTLLLARYNESSDLLTFLCLPNNTFFQSFQNALLFPIQFLRLKKSGISQVKQRVSDRNEIFWSILFEDIRTATIVAISTPSVVIQAELREVPLRDRFQLISDTFFMKSFHKINHSMFSNLEELDYTSQNNKSHCSFNKHFFLLKSYSKFRGYSNRVLRISIPMCLLILYESQFFQLLIDLQSGPTIYNSKSPDTVFNNIISLKYPNHKHFYTDGSKSVDSLVVLFVYSPQLDLEKKLNISEYASI